MPEGAGAVPCAAATSTAFFASDNQTHSILCQGCGKPHIWQIIESSTADYMRARVLNIAAAAEQMNILYSQHQALAEAILRHDAQRGIAIMEEHINKGIIDVEVCASSIPITLSNAWTLPAGRFGREFFLLSAEIRLKIAAIRQNTGENCQEYTGVYGAGMFGSIGVIMPISCP